MFKLIFWRGAKRICKYYKYRQYSPILISANIENKNHADDDTATNDYLGRKPSL